MAEQTIRFFEFLQNDLREEFELVGYRRSDRREIRTSFNDLLFSLGLIDYSKEDLNTWLDQGHSWLDIGIFLLQKENLKRSIAEPFIFSRLPSVQVNTLIDYLKTEEGFLKTGIAFCDGSPFVDNSGSSWNLENRFIRAYSQNALEEGEPIIPYQTQEDAMQKITGGFGKGASQGAIFDVNATSNSASGVFKMGVVNIGLTGGAFNLKAGGVDFDSSRVARTSDETRPKNIYFPYFQVVRKLDFRSLPKVPEFLLQNE